MEIEFFYILLRSPFLKPPHIYPLPKTFAPYSPSLKF